jgi:hypothetical protein
VSVPAIDMFGYACTPLNRLLPSPGVHAVNRTGAAPRDGARPARAGEGSRRSRQRTPAHRRPRHQHRVSHRNARPFTPPRDKVLHTRVAVAGALQTTGAAGVARVQTTGAGCKAAVAALLCALWRSVLRPGTAVDAHTLRSIGPSTPGGTRTTRTSYLPGEKPVSDEVSDDVGCCEVHGWTRAGSSASCLHRLHHLSFTPRGFHSTVSVQGGEGRGQDRNVCYCHPGMALSVFYAQPRFPYPDGSSPPRRVWWLGHFFKCRRGVARERRGAKGCE